MGPGDLVRVHLPSRYHGIDHIDRLQGKIGVITEVENIDNGTWGMHNRACVLVEGAVRQFDIKYLEPVDEAG